MTSLRFAPVSCSRPSRESTSVQAKVKVTEVLSFGGIVPDVADSEIQSAVVVIENSFSLSLLLVNEISAVGCSVPKNTVSVKLDGETCNVVSVGDGLGVVVGVGDEEFDEPPPHPIKPSITAKIMVVVKKVFFTDLDSIFVVDDREGKPNKPNERPQL